MELLAWVLLGSLLSPAITSPVPNGHVLHECSEDQHSPWTKLERLDRRSLLPVRIGLSQRNLDIGNDLLMNVSVKGSSSYGKFYTASQVTEIFAPGQEAVDAVRLWLESAGIDAWRILQSVNKQWLQFDATAEIAEQLFNTKYHVYEHKISGSTNVGCDEYYLPASIRKHIDYITPGIKLHTHSGLRRPAKTIKKRTGDNLPARSPRSGPRSGPKKPLPAPVDIVSQNPLTFCDRAITPACIRAMYNITAGTTAAAGNELGIYEDLGDVYSQEDLDLFFAKFASHIPEGTHPTLDAIDGAVAPTSVANAGGESDLDFQISYPIIWPQNSILFQTDDPVYEANFTWVGFLDNFFDAIDGSYCSNSTSALDPPYPDPAPGGYKGQLQCGLYSPTNVISISYGRTESQLPVSYQRRLCTEIMKLGLQGVTVIVASGDLGVAGIPFEGGGANGCLGPDDNIFSPEFPATCPYITAVGATYLPPGGDASKDEEISSTEFYSGGGFSNIYTVSEASWQEPAVSAYFAQDLVDYPYYNTVNNESIGANGGIYNRNGRGYPDLAAVGNNIAVFYEGESGLTDGTSASAPTFAAIVTRINEARILKGMGTVGFLNPTLYANPHVFHDITVGNNSGCGTAGFYASTGWDPVSGLGTPNFPALLDLFTS